MISLRHIVLGISILVSIPGSLLAYAPSLAEANALHEAQLLLQKAPPSIQADIETRLTKQQTKAKDEWTRFCVQHLLTHLRLLAQQSSHTSLSSSPIASPQAQGQGPARVRVTKVIDGDTIQVAVDSAVITIRLLGVDTPEKNEQGYEEAKHRISSLLLGNDILVLTDPDHSIPYDKYGRLLAYVYLDDLLINLDLIEKGYARAYTIQPHLFTSLFVTADEKWLSQTPIRRRYCSEFTSCDQARDALQDGASYLDGDQDAVPCEQGVCKGV